MTDFSKISLTRNQLAKFLPNHESIKEFERLFKQDTELATTVLNIIEGAGLNDDGTYTPLSPARYIELATSLFNADALLDEAIWDNTRDLIINIAVDTQLQESSLIVLCDATAGAINATLPNPANCFENNRSFEIAITKIDTSANVINILPFSAEFVVGEASQQLLLNGEILNFITDGTNWYLRS